MIRHARFGMSTLTFLVVANMVGAGVFTTSGFTLADLGSPGWVVAAWMVGGAIALAGAASYGRLIRLMPESGGEYLFLSRAWHPLLGFIAGWVSLIAGFTGAIAFAATAFETYAFPEGARPDWLPKDLAAIASILVFGLFHGWRPGFGASFQNTFVVLKLLLLMVFLGFALFRMGVGDGAGSSLDMGPASGWRMTTAFANALVWISLSYSGFNAAVYVAEEAQAPRDLVPKSLLLGTSLVTLLYILLNAVFVYAPPAGTVAGQPDVAAVAAEWLGGKGLANLVRGIICLALLTSVSSMMMAAPRVYAKMAEDGLLPKGLRFSGEAPRVAIALQVGLASGIVLVSSLQELLSYLGLTLSLSAACSAACLLLPRLREKPLFHTTHAIPLFYILATLIAGFLMAVRSPLQVAATALTFALGAVVYGLTVASESFFRSPSRR